ncbi:MAG: AsmA family protein, partial [Magnetococcales bacterium]|nr:AsmA family protein [Magnetococcales bacterium]
MKNADIFIFKSATLLIYTVLALLVLSSLLALTLPFLLNPTYYKTQMADRVLEKTGRTLTFAGAIEWHMFPEPSLSMEDLALSNAPGFSAEPMVKIQRLQGKLNLWDLLKMQFAMKQLSLTGVEVLLESDAAGRNNWDDLMARSAAARGEESVPEESASVDDLPDMVAPSGRASVSVAQLGTLALSALSVRAITLREGSGRYCRPGAGDEPSCLQALHVHFTPQSTGGGTHRPVQVQADLTIPDPPFAGHVSLSYRQPARTDRAITHWQNTEIIVRGQVDLPPAKELELVWRSHVTMGPEPHSLHISQGDSRLTVWSDGALFREFTLTSKGAAEADLSTGKVRLPQGGVTWRVKSDQLPPAGVELAFHSPIDMDWRQETVHINPLRISGPAQIQMEGHLHGDHLLSRPSVDVELSSVRFSPGDLWVAMGRSLPPINDPTAMQAGAGSAIFHMDERSLAVTRMVLDLGGARIAGDLSWQIGEEAVAGKSMIRFDLQGESLDLDRLFSLERNEAGRASQWLVGVMAPESWLPELPVAWLDGVDLQGRLRLGELRLAATRLTDLSLAMELRDRQLRLQPYRLSAHDGVLEGRVQWDLQGAEPQLVVDKSITDMQLEPLLRPFPPLRWLRGSANLVTHLSSRGRDAEGLWKNLQGNLSVMVQEGSVQGLDMGERFREAHAAQREQRASSAGQEKSGSEKSGGRGGSTPFRQLTATAQIAAGMLENSDLRLFSPTLQVSGKGRLSLPTAWVDYTLEVDGTGSMPAGATSSG